MNYKELLRNDAKFIKSGKVRDIFELDEDKFLLIATDRISTFDVVFPTDFSDKGKLLTQISNFWFDKFTQLFPNHIIETDFSKFPASLRKFEELKDRSVIVKKCKIVPIEAIVRGYITGSAWKNYKESGEIFGLKFDNVLQESEKFKFPLFTPTTKAEVGYDENITMEQFKEIATPKYADKIKDISIELYNKANEFANQRGLIIADTKFEFGIDKDGNLILVDELLTPDSSRYWSLKSYKLGAPQESYDKQFVRNYVEKIGWNKNPPAPELPKEIVDKTMKLYNITLKKILD